MEWSEVGGWVKKNLTGGAALVGSLLTGNVQGAIAAGASLISSATGTDDPAQALQMLQSDPATRVKLQELANQEAASIREHLRTITLAKLQDAQAEHKEQQDTIRGGDVAQDEYVRRTRPMMARQSWYATVVYIFASELAHAAKLTAGGANWEIASILLAPAAAYLGFRSLDKFSMRRRD
jgi:hypothetical protein